MEEVIGQIEGSLGLKENQEEIFTSTPNKPTTLLNSYSDNKEGREKVEILEDNLNTFDNSTTTEETTDLYSFFTSTPKSESDRCEECLDNTECVDCIVKHVLRKHESLRKLLF